MNAENNISIYRKNIFGTLYRKQIWLVHCLDHVTECWLGFVGKKKEIIVEVASLAIMWVIWKERNNRIFSDKLSRKSVCGIELDF